MTKNDTELIQRTLAGDQRAFAVLVEKYQKGIHADVWKRIGDFHIAQEITQDAFLRAYQELGNLKNYNAFAGWLNVIALRLCFDWLRKNRLPMESLDTTDASEVDSVSYSQHVAEKQEAEVDEARREVVKKLLRKLPERERTVRLIAVPGMPDFGDIEFDTEQLTENINLALVDALHDEAKKSIKEGKKLSPEHFDAGEFNEAFSKFMEERVTNSRLVLVNSVCPHLLRSQIRGRLGCKGESLGLPSLGF